MNAFERKLSLVGWGNNQLVLHENTNGLIGVSFWKDRKLEAFSLTPWLRGHFAVIKVEEAQRERRYPDEKLIRHMCTEAMKAAHEAIEAKDIYLLSEAIITSYMGQQMIGYHVLPERHEIGKRYTGNGTLSLYLFSTPERASKLKDLNWAVAT